MSKYLEEYKFINVNNCMFRCAVITATPDLPWLVFSNSLITDLSVWEAQVAEFAGAYNILTYDQRGHGGTIDYQAGFNMVQLGDDLIKICESLNIEQINYVGLSMGVPTGLAAYTAKPELFQSLTLVDGLCKSTSVSAQGWADRIQFVKQHGIEKFADETIQRWFSESSRNSGIADAVHNMMKSTRVNGFIDCAKALQDFNFESTLEKIQVPTLLIAGGNDGNMPNSVAAMGEQIAISTYHTIEDAGHNPNVEQSQAFNKLLKEFLAV